VNKRKVKRVVIQLKPEHVALIKKALTALGRKEEARAFAEEEAKLKEEVLRALEGRAVL
jgi:hypothetical protein